MKKIILFTLLTASLIFISSCKKEDDAAAPTNQTTPVNNIDSSSIYYARNADFNINVDFNNQFETNGLNSGYTQGNYPSPTKDYYIEYNSSITDNNINVGFGIVGIETNYDEEPQKFKNLLKTGSYGIVDSTFDSQNDPVKFRFDFTDEKDEYFSSKYASVAADDFVNITKINSGYNILFGDTIHTLTIEGEYTTSLSNYEGTKTKKLKNVQFKTEFENRF